MSTETTTEKEIKVFELDFGDTNLLDKDPQALLDFIKSDIEGMGDAEELEYKITIRRMTQKKIDDLPEWA
jgi:hypothetical protein